jgi:hypothetical protein
LSVRAYPEYLGRYVPNKEEPERDERNESSRRRQKSITCSSSAKIEEAERNSEVRGDVTTGFVCSVQTPRSNWAGTDNLTGQINDADNKKWRKMSR